MKPAAAAHPDTAVTSQPSGLMAPAAPRLSLHIDRLVLHGSSFVQSDGARIEQAFQGEVRRLVAAGDVRVGLAGAQALDRLRLADLHVDGSATPDQLGRQLARGLMDALAPSPSRAGGSASGGRA